MDSICDVPALARQYQTPVAAMAMNKTTTAATQYLRAEASWVAAGNIATDFPDSVSRVRRFESARGSEAKTGPEIARTGWTAGEEGAAATGPGPEGGAITGVAGLAAEPLPESISRLNPFRSAPILETPWEPE